METHDANSPCQQLGPRYHARPAHPAIVKRELIEKSNGLKVRSRGWSGGAKDKFEEWFVGFLQQDQRIRDKMYGREAQ